MSIFNMQGILSPERIMTLIRFVLLVFLGLPISFVLSRTVQRYTAKRLSAQQGLIAGKIVLYGALLVILFSALNELGFELTHLLAAAGVVGIAVGFAAQTSVSNIISGLFLMGERPFVIGDAITVGNTTGKVLSIDILSVKMRTFDNRFVRIPNETIIKGEVINLSYFPIRRIDLNLSVAYKEKIGRVRELLLDVALRNPLCLQEPQPIIIFSGFGASSIDLFFGVWAERDDYLALKNSIQEEIKQRFDDEGIEIPFPHISLYKGSATEPFPVQLVDCGGKSADHS